jgi:hypothetical protein
MSKQSDELRLWADRKFKCLLAHCMANTQARGFSSPLRIFREMQMIMSLKSAARGSSLAELMIEIDVAAATDATYTVKRIDNDFFESI